MGESKKAFAADGDVKLRTHIGGQALIEGVMMRGKYNWAVAVRQPDGSIYTEEHDLASGKEKNSWMYWPIIRGCRAFVESLGLGYKALNISADHAYDWDEEDEDSDSATWAAAKSAICSDSPDSRGCATGASGSCGTRILQTSPLPAGVSSGEFEAAPQRDGGGIEDCLSAEGASTADADGAQGAGAELSAEETQAGNAAASSLGPLMTVSMIIGLVLGVVIFVVVPAALSNLIMGEAQMNSMGWNVLDGVLRVGIFIAYIWLISLMKDIHRLFQYHGAEHKTIHCFEHGLELTPENAESFPRLHVRCGTAFMIMVMIIAIFVYTALGQPINALVDMTGVSEGPARFALIVATRIVLLPLIAGISYEISVKWAGQHPDNLLVRIVLWPGMQMQRLTTNLPDEGMLECAITAMKLVVAREELEAAKAAQPASAKAMAPRGEEQAA